MNEIMNTRLYKNPIDGLCARCDWMVTGESFTKIKTTDQPQLVFLSTNIITKGQLVFLKFSNEVLPLIKNEFTLIVGSEDHTFPYDIGDKRFEFFAYCRNEISHVLKHPLVRRIYVENLDSIHHKCFPIPLGLIKTMEAYEECEKMCYEATPVDYEMKSLNVFCCHKNRIGQQWVKRELVTQLAKQWSPYVQSYDHLDEMQFLKKLKQSRFCLCAQGGGYDPSPKCWQAIICGSIPIIEHSPLDWAYERLPVVFVDSWEENTLTETKLTVWFEKLKPFYADKEKRAKVMKLMQLDYWYNLIVNHDDKYEVIAILSDNMARAREKKIRCTYGTDVIRQDVTNLFFKHFCVGDKIVVPEMANFNFYFGDPCVNQKKYVEIVIRNDIVIRLEEAREKSFSFAI